MSSRPQVSHLREENGVLRFTLSHLDVSYANAIRRTLLSDIPTVVFRTSPHEANRATIHENTTRLHNELIKQRLSCVPIHIADVDAFEASQYQVELDVENRTDTTLMVTTEHFAVKHMPSGKYVDKAQVRQWFPPFVPMDGSHEYFIDLVRLRPKLSDELPGEKIKLSCILDKGTAREDSMFNVVGTCSYGATPDAAEQQAQLQRLKQQWKDAGQSEAEVKFSAKNWLLLDGQRVVVPNSFDFVVESLGIFSNQSLMRQACGLLLLELDELKTMVDRNEVAVAPSQTTLENCYDVTLENEHYTIGNLLNFELYRMFYQERPALDFVGFKKMHPHDSHSVLRMSLQDKGQGVEVVRQLLVAAIEQAMQQFGLLRGMWASE